MILRDGRNPGGVDLGPVRVLPPVSDMQLIGGGVMSHEDQTQEGWQDWGHFLRGSRPPRKALAGTMSWELHWTDCPQCGKRYQAKRHQVYCSTKCGDLARTHRLRARQRAVP